MKLNLLLLLAFMPLVVLAGGKKGNTGAAARDEPEDFENTGIATRGNNPDSNRVYVCHKNGQSGKWQKIEVDDNGAFNGHMTHGDGEPGKDLADGSGHLDEECNFTPFESKGAASRPNDGDASRSSALIVGEEEDATTALIEEEEEDATTAPTKEEEEEEEGATTAPNEGDASRSSALIVGEEEDATTALIEEEEDATTAPIEDEEEEDATTAPTEDEEEEDATTAPIEDEEEEDATTAPIEDEEEEDATTAPTAKNYEAFGDGERDSAEHTICAAPSTATCHDMLTSDGVLTGGACVDVKNNALKITLSSIDEYALVRTQVWAGQDVSEMPTKDGIPDTAKFPHYQCDFRGEMQNSWTLKDIAAQCGSLTEGDTEFTLAVVAHSVVTLWNENGRADLDRRLDSFAGAITDGSFDVIISCDCPEEPKVRRRLRSRKATPAVTSKPIWLQ